MLTVLKRDVDPVDKYLNNHTFCIIDDMAIKCNNIYPRERYNNRLCETCLALKAFTGYDNLSNFVGNEKIKLVKTMSQDELFVQLFELIVCENFFAESNKKIKYICVKTL